MVGQAGGCPRCASRCADQPRRGCTRPTARPRVPRSWSRGTHRAHASRVPDTSTPEVHGADLTTQHRQLQTANFPLDPDGRTYHVGTKKGEVANRILGVGSLGRARMLGALLEPLPDQARVRAVESSRGFLTTTGLWQGCPVSVVTHLMGFGNLDLFLRETRAVTDPPLLVIRIGTCGSLNRRVGQLHIPSRGSVAVLRNPDAFHPDAVNGSTEAPYRVTRAVLPDGPLTKALIRETAALIGGDGVHEGMNASADSFFSSQGRLDPHFDDRNEGVLEELLRQHPDVSSLEMESFHLFHLAQCSYGHVRATAGALSLACRLSNQWIDVSKVNELEVLAGKAALNALVNTSVADEHSVSMNKSRHVWAD